MADSVIALPYNATTSGDQLDATSISVGGVTVKRERMVIGNDTSSHVAIVSSSGALSISRTPTSLTSGIITLSSNPTVVLSSPTSLSSGTVTLSSNPTVILSSPTSLSSGLVTLTGTNVVTNASSGLVQVLQSTGIWAISGTVLSASSGLVQVLQSTGAWAITGSSTAVGIIGSTGTALVVTSGGVLSAGILSSGGIYAPVTSSGGLLIQVSTQGVGFMASTAINVLGTAGTNWIISSAGVGLAAMVSSGGIFAPVTSSAGLIVTLATGAGSGGAGSTAVNLPVVSAAGFGPVTSSQGLQVRIGTTGALIGTVTATLGAPLTKSLTTAALYLYSITFATTGGTAGQALGIHSATSALSTNTPVIALTNPAAVTMSQVYFPRGVSFPTGIQVTDALTFGTTTTNTTGVLFTFEYEV